MVFCQGTCGVEEALEADGVTVSTTMRKLTGSWYFTPETDNLMTWYIKTADGTAYTAEETFVRFGHWLSENSSTTTLTDINTFAYTNGAGTVEGTDYDITSKNSATGAILTDAEATYTGKAAGMSLQMEIDSDGETVAGTMHSGAFTADVNLTATFGGSPTLRGIIDNFESDNMYAVDPNWTVELQVRSFSDGTDEGTFNDGRAIATGQDGVWSATAYGSATQTKVDTTTGVPDDAGTDTLSVRPTGIFGSFNANFKDGRAAGAYATR